MDNREKTIRNVIQWNKSAIRKAEREKDTAAVERYNANIASLEAELKGL